MGHGEFLLPGFERQRILPHGTGQHYDWYLQSPSISSTSAREVVLFVLVWIGSTTSLLTGTPL